MKLPDKWQRATLKIKSTLKNNQISFLNKGLSFSPQETHLHWTVKIQSDALQIHTHRKLNAEEPYFLNN